MRSPRTPRLLEEIDRYRLRFTCEDCAQLEPGTETCSLGYPNAMHKRDADPDEIVFCKEFELA